MKCKALPSSLLGFFLNEFNKFTITGAQMLVFCLFVCLI